jgi:hypothetical protein
MQASTVLHARPGRESNRAPNDGLSRRFGRRGGIIKVAHHWTGRLEPVADIHLEAAYLPFYTLFGLFVVNHRSMPDLVGSQFNLGTVVKGRQKCIVQVSVM